MNCLAILTLDHSVLLTAEEKKLIKKLNKIILCVSVVLCGLIFFTCTRFLRQSCKVGGMTEMTFREVNDFFQGQKLGTG